MKVTSENLKEVLHYDPESGIFWYKETCGTRKRGTRAGSLRSDGYVAIGVDGKKQGAHRIAWRYHYGVEPSGIVDHINGIRNDNWIANLRDTTMLANRHNWDLSKPRGSNYRGKLRAQHEVPEWKPETFGEELTQDFLKAMFNYDPETGIFTWKKARATNNGVGAVAGNAHPQYKYIYINLSVGGKKYHHMAHRLAWLYVHGKLPDNVIDHINGIRDDNRICNLRDVTQSQNLMNTWSKKNKTGYPGIYRDKNRWGTAINVNGKRIHLGTYLTAAEAYMAYLVAKTKYHGDFIRMGEGKVGPKAYQGPGDFGKVLAA